MLYKANKIVAYRIMAISKKEQDFNAEKVLIVADNALYTAKKEGRNKFVTEIVK